MKKLILGILLTAIAIPTAPVAASEIRSGSSSQLEEIGGHSQFNDRRDDNDRARGERRNRDGYGNRGRHRGQQKRAAWEDYHRYDYNRYDPQYGNYRANRYHRDGRYYQDRRLSNRDRIYRGSDNRYYCRRNDGTTGLIIGAVGGGVLGRAIAPNGSKTLGTILGGASGALIGRSIGRGGVRCN